MEMQKQYTNMKGGLRPPFTKGAGAFGARPLCVVMFVYCFCISVCGIVLLLCVLCVLCVLCSVSALRVSLDLCFFGVGWVTGGPREDPGTDFRIFGRIPAGNVIQNEPKMCWKQSFQRRMGPQSESQWTREDSPTRP